MRTVFSVVLGCFGVLTLINIIITCTIKDSKESKRNVVHLLVSAALMCVVQIVYMHVIKRTPSMLCIGIYAALEYWTMYFSVVFVEEYAKTFKENERVRMFFLAFGFVDTFAMLTNHFSTIAFDVSPTMYKLEPVYAVSHLGIFYYAHVIVLVFLTFIILSALTYRVFIAPNSFTRKKFLFIFLAAWATFFGRIIILISDKPFDHNVILICIFANSISLFAYGYVPRLLNARITKTLVNEMSSSVVLFDSKKEEILYKNESAETLVNSSLFYKITYEGFENLKNVEDETPFFYEVSVVFGDVKRTYSVSARNLIEGTELVGILFTFVDRTEEIREIERNYYIMTHDPLTGIYNYDFFCQRAKETIDNNPNTDYYLVTTDILEFKLYNELFGSDKGDEVLVTTAKLLSKYCSDNSVYGRIKDDELAVLVRAEDYSDSLFIEHIMRIREMFSSGQYKIYMNAGVYKIIDRTEPIYSMCDKTKLAINEIKDNYSVVLNHFSDVYLERNIQRRWILDELDNALATSQFKMFLQPQVDSRTGEWVGAEALVRWMHPERGMISPGEFIPVIENAGVISKVDLYIWNQAALKLAEWKMLGKDELYISVNVSGKDFYFTDIYEVFTGLVRTYGIAPSRLRIEITESVLVNNVKMMTEVISKLRTNGFIVEIDDFGSGYSSLNSLKDYEVDVIKMDMGFLAKSSDEEKSQMIFTDVVQMIKRLDMDIVVEGVEEENQIRFLSEMGCNIIQGYYYSKPLPIKGYEEKIGL